MPCSSSGAADWFVAPGGKGGDGSRAKPFHDPYLALRAVAPGDSIHVAEGVYYGKLDRSSWVIDRPRVTILGGYSRDFARRDPWKTPSVFAAARDCQALRDPNMLLGQGDHAGLVLDGFTFDSGGRNGYGDRPFSALRNIPGAETAIASFHSADVTIRNCLFANSTTGGVELAGEGSRFENNVTVNQLGIGMLVLRAPVASATRPILVKSNTFAFALDEGGTPGIGADHGVGIRVYGPATLQDNAFIACANYGVTLFVNPDRVSIERNVFWASPHDAIGRRVAGAEADITEKNFDEIEDIGLKSTVGNAVKDPGLAGIRPEWLDGVTRNILTGYRTAPREALAAMRSKANLGVYEPHEKKPVEKPVDPPVVGPDGAEGPVAVKPEDPAIGSLAPYLAVPDCLAIRTAPGAGAAPVELKAEPFADAKPLESPEYERIDWEMLARGDAALANRRVEVLVGFSFESNFYMLKDVNQDQFVGFKALRVGKADSDEWMQLYLKRGSIAHRQYDEAQKYNAARDVDDAYLVRGVCRTDTGNRQKATLVIESIMPAPFAMPVENRPAGRQWFVRAGSSGGDGSREKPFRDPFQALDKAEGGDTLHVAAGDYYGKLRSGNWKIPFRNLALIGGYDAEFKSRDPWKNPTRLVLDEKEKAKGKHSGTFLESADPTDGLLLDGFVFDGSTTNAYMPTGAVDLKKSPGVSMVDLRAARGSLTVRNCVFVNACGNAIALSAPSGTFENNVVLNTAGFGVLVRGGGAGPWIVRNNTLLFACDGSQRAGTGESSAAGVLLSVGGRARTLIENNLLALSEDCALRCEMRRQQSVWLTGNVLAANLAWSLTDGKYLWAQTSNWDRALTDADFASVKGNITDLPTALPLDRAYLDRVLPRLFALPSRRTAEEWKTIASTLGATVSPAGAAPIATPGAKPGEPKKESSLDDLMADLTRMKSELSAQDAIPGAPPFAPAYDWHKAIELARDGTPAVGARKLKLEVAIPSEASSLPTKKYEKITFAQVESARDALDGKPVEIDGSPHPHGYSGLAPEFARDQYDEYTLAPPESIGRLPVTLFVRQDSAASRAMNNITDRDTARFRGIAKVLPKYRGLCVVVEAVERIDK